MSDDILTRLLSLNHPDAADAADEIERLATERDEERALADKLARSLLDGSFRGNSSDRRDRMYGSGWAAVHDALDDWEEARRG